MAESKAKSKVSGKPVSAVAEAKPKAKTAKPAAGKTTAKSAAAAKPKAAKAKAVAPAAGKVPAKRSMEAPNPAVSAEQRYRMIAEAAYYIAERRNFAPGDVAADWEQAEAQIAVLLNRK